MSHIVAGVAMMLLLASPALAQPVTSPSLNTSDVLAQDEGTAVVEHIIIDYSTYSVEQKFIVLADGKKVRIKGANSLASGDRVKVKKSKIRKLEKARVQQETTEAEVDVADLVPEVVLESINPNLPAPTSYALDVVFVDWSVPSPNATQSIATSEFAKIDAQYRENTYGALGWTPKFFWVSIAPPNMAACEYSNVMAAARAVITAQGISLTGRNQQFLIPGYSPCGWGGIAGVNATWSVLNNTGYWASVHELGHNLGMSHSNYKTCNAAGCQVQEYRDEFDPMGLGGPDRKAFNAFQKTSRGWIVPLQITDGVSGIFTLAPYETISMGQKALRVHIRDASSSSGFKYYFVESRGLYNNGAVLIHEFRELQDLAPLTDQNDQVLDPGQTFVFQDGTALTTIASSVSGATVRVQRQGAPNRKPSKPTRIRVEST